MAESNLQYHLLSRLHTGCEDTFTICVANNGTILTGHCSTVRIWSIQQTSKTLKKYNLLFSLMTPVESEVTCTIQFPNEEHQFAVSVDKSVLIYDIASSKDSSTLLHQFCFNSEEINQIDIHPKGTFLCASDDSGEIKVIDVKNACLFKTLSRQHDNICSTVKFNTRKTWEIISAGMDCKIVRWDFSRSRPLFVLPTHTEYKVAYMINPPMVHSLDVIPSKFFIVCGLGNGNVSVYSLRSPKCIESACTAQLHKTTVSQVCCIEIEGPSKLNKSSFVISGGDDGILCVCKLTEVEITPQKDKQTSTVHCTKMELELLAEIKHGSKVNWIALSGTNCDDGCFSIYVADLTKFVSVYQIKV